MNKEIKSNLFKTELNNIKDEGLRFFVKTYLEENVPEYFFAIGASSSGKYHPKFSQGEGGLVRHTKAVCAVAEELLRMSSYAYMPEIYQDYVRAACILHDTAKYGMSAEMNKEEYANHAPRAAVEVAEAWNALFENEAPFLLTNAIRSHMGQWSTDKADRPFTNLDRCVHLSDYVASRNFIEMPSIVEDYQKSLTIDESGASDDYPF